MKKLTQITLLAFTLVFSQTGLLLAHNDEGTATQVSVRQIKTEQKKAIVQVTHLPVHQPAILKIKDQEGRILHKEIIRQRSSYAKKFDLSQYAAGDYRIELKTRDSVITKVLALKEGQVNLQHFRPAIQLTKGVIKVDFINRLSTPVTLKLYDRSGTAVYEKAVPSQERFSKGLDISSIHPGPFAISIMGNNYTYSKTISVK